MTKKSKLILWLVLILFAIAVSIFSFGSADEVVNDVRFTHDVVVEEGVAKETSYTIPFTLKEDGYYAISADWKAEKEGVITGFAVRNPENEIVFCVTGESVDAESKKLNLKAGKYRAEYLFFTDEEQLAALVEEAEATNYSKETNEYVYATNISYETEYHFALERWHEGVSKPWLLGAIIIGLAVGIVLVAMILKFVKTDASDKAKYDERQLRVRGDGFKYGFFTGLIYNTALCLAHIAEITLPVAEEVLLFLGIIVSILVYAIYCIRKEAYVSLNESAFRFKMIFTVLGVINLGMGIMSLVHGKMIENGIITFQSLNLLCGIFLLVIALVLHIQNKIAERNEE